MKTIKWLLVALLLASSTVFAGQPYQMTNAEKRCMKTALYHESRGEPDRGMFAVASVIMSRLNDERFPGENVCEIVYQKGQFTFDKSKKMTEPDAIAKATGVIEAIESGFMSHMPFLYFHNVNVKGMCSSKKNRVRIGNHYFCS
jgi:spore germination cell wall hydrolase CwlJ-like protein